MDTFGLGGNVHENAALQTPSEGCHYRFTLTLLEVAMPSLEEVVSKHDVGHIFWLSPHLLGMTPEVFDSFARQAWAAGGGDGFEILDFKKESQSGDGLYALLQCKRA